MHNSHSSLIILNVDRITFASSLIKVQSCFLPYFSCYSAFVGRGAPSRAPRAGSCLTFLLENNCPRRHVLAKQGTLLEKRHRGQRAAG